MFDLGRVIILVFPIVFMNTQPFATLILMNLILIAYIIFFVFVRPYRENLLFVNQLIIELATFVSYFGALCIAY